MGGERWPRSGERRRGRPRTLQETAPAGGSTVGSSAGQRRPLASGAERVRPEVPSSPPGSDGWRDRSVRTLSRQRRPRGRASPLIAEGWQGQLTRSRLSRRQSSMGAIGWGPLPFVRRPVPSRGDSRGAPRALRPIRLPGLSMLGVTVALDSTSLPNSPSFHRPRPPTGRQRPHY